MLALLALVAIGLLAGFQGTVPATFPLTSTQGGTGQNTSASTGVAQVASGTWSASTALASGTTATTQAAAENSTKVATTAYVDRVAQGTILWAWCTGAVGTGNATEYTLLPVSGATGSLACTNTTVPAANNGVPLPFACTAKNLYVSITTAGSAAGSSLITVYKSGVAQALTCTAGTANSCSDTSHSFAFAAGDGFQVTVKTGQASDTTAGVRVAIQCI